MGNKKQWMLNSLFLIVTLGITFFAIFHGEDPDLLLRLLDIADGRYWAAAFIPVLAFICCESWNLYLLLKNSGESPLISHCLIYSFIGFFFCCITPAAGGGQPAQVYYMHKDGLNPGKTTPILLVITICYKLVLVILGILVFILRPKEWARVEDGSIVWCTLGWLFTTATVVLFLLLVFYPGIVETVFNWALKLLHGRISEERMDRWREKLQRTIANYHETTKCIRSNPLLFWKVLAISFLQRALLFSVTWFVIRSYDIRGGSLLSIMLMQAMVNIGADMLPLPGGSGANEALFLLLFESICGPTLVLPTLLASRGISYYGQLLICGAVFLIAGRKLGGTAKNSK